MEKKLLKLWKMVPSGQVKADKLAAVLELSIKQTARLLQKWRDEGWLNYIPGRGRGKHSELQWLKNVEEEYEKKIAFLMEEVSLETISGYLLYDWSTEARQRLMHDFQSKLGFVHNAEQQDTLIIPQKYQFVSLTPIEAADVGSANLVSNLFNRLVNLDENGRVTGDLAHSWEETENCLRLYLKKDCLFHDGSVMTADDVTTCLNRVREHSYFKALWEPIKFIETPAPLVVDFYFPGGCSYVLPLLSTINASISKEASNRLIGTGPFYIEKQTEKKLTLAAFKDYFKERPLLDRIDFIKVPKDFEVVYRSGTKVVPEKTFDVESDSGFGVVIMNPLRGSETRRKEVRDYIHYLIAKNRHEIGYVSKRLSSNSKSCLLGEDQAYWPRAVNQPMFHEPVVIRIVGYSRKVTEWLKEVLESEGVPVEIREVDFEDSIKNSAQNRNCDLFVHGEIFELNQNLSYFTFLTNGYSPLTRIMNADPNLKRLLDKFTVTPFKDWTALNLKVERALMEASLLVPLYSERRQIPFSMDLRNVKLKHFGYVDFSKLWVSPSIKKASV